MNYGFEYFQSRDSVKLALGTEQLGGTDWGPVDEDEIKRAVLAAYDLGIRVFDTAGVYGLGRSEERLGDALADARSDALIVTKGGLRWRRQGPGRAEVWTDARPPSLRKDIEASLRRLRLSSLPAFLIHRPDYSVPLEDSIAFLASMRDQGHVRMIGVGNLDRRLSDFKDPSAIDMVQLPFSLLTRDAGEIVGADSSLAGLTTMAYGVLEQGLLTGKYGPQTDFPRTDRRHRLPQFQQEAWPRNSSVLRALKKVSERSALSVAGVAIAWASAQPWLDFPIVGAKRVSHVREAVRATTESLSPEDLDALNRAVKNGR